jgi:hypothetical protein
VDVVGSPSGAAADVGGVDVKDIQSTILMARPSLRG